MLFLGLDKVLVGSVDVLMGLFDVLLGDVQLGALLVNESLHVLLHSERVDHSAFDLFDFLLLDFDHAFVVQRLLVHFVHLNLRKAAFAVLILVLDLRLAELSVFVGGRLRMLERVVRRAVTCLVSVISRSLSYS